MITARPLLILSAPTLAPFQRIGAPFQPRTIATWDDLLAEMRDLPPAGTVLLDPYQGAPVDAAPDSRLWETLRAFPSVSVVVALRFRPERTRDVARMLEQGVSEVLNLDRETDPALARVRLLGTLARPLKRMLEDGLPRHLSGDARTLLRAAAEVVALGGGSPELARVFGVLPDTPAGWCRAAGLPPPRNLLAWMRVLFAAALLGDQGRTVQGVARACGYATDRSLRRVVGRFVGRQVAGLRREGAFPLAMAAFNEELRARRERALLRPAKAEAAQRPRASAPEHLAVR